MQKISDQAITTTKQLAHLRRDPVLRKIITALPAMDHTWDRKRPDHFRSLVTAIVNQQLSGKAAATILARFVALFPKKKFPKPEDVVKMAPVKMREAGLSKMKVSFLKDLARHVINNSVDFKTMKKLSDAEVIEHLVRVKGIGRWTAEMFLMFSLGRPDVFSYGDLGLRNAMQKLYGLKKHPTEKQAEKITAMWRPYRTLASRYLWASVDFESGKKSAKKTT
jgi:DNA-3-methyladenine glycosylase II